MTKTKTKRKKKEAVKKKVKVKQKKKSLRKKMKSMMRQNQRKKLKKINIVIFGKNMEKTLNWVLLRILLIDRNWLNFLGGFLLKVWKN
jgi:hypothetical protein